MKVLLTATVQSHICQFHKPLVEMLHEHGCEVHVAARDNLAEKNGLKLDFVEKIFDIPFSRSPYSLDNIRAYKKLKKIIESGNYEVVHCNTPMGGIVSRLAVRKARRKGTKIYYTAHGFHFYQGAAKMNWIVFYPIEKFFSRMTDKLITITNEDFDLASKKFNCQVERIHGVGVDKKKFCKIKSEENEMFRIKQGYQGRFVILCVGELNKNKNQITVIKAVKHLINTYPNILLLLAGNGSEEVNLKKRICEWKLEKYIKFLGYRTDLEKYVNACDIVVSASRREGLPMNIMEAMICGKPVVASNNRGHNELIVDNETGFLVSPFEEYDYANKIELLIENEVIREKISEEAKKRIGIYASINVARELRKIYFGK